MQRMLYQDFQIQIDKFSTQLFTDLRTQWRTMPSNEWLKNNPKITGSIPKALKDKLQNFSKDQNISISEALRIILENYFSETKFSTSSQLLTQSSQPVLNSIEDRLKYLETQIQKHSDIIEKFKISQKNEPKVLNSVENPKLKSSQLVPNRSQLTIFDGWLTTGEAYAELQQRGYEKSQGTFRRTLKEGQVPPELELLGLMADFGARNAANPKDNSVRWLKVKSIQ